MIFGLVALCTAGELMSQDQAEAVQPAPQNPASQNAAQPLPPGMQPSELGFRDFEGITTDIKLRDESLPADYTQRIFEEKESDQPSAALSYFYWDAPEIWYHPLYFDDVPLERYGQTPCPKLQPFLSAAHFFGNVPLLPYKMGIDSPFGYVTNLGYYRPGSPTPCIGRRLPWETDAAALEAATALSLIFLLP
jgi:hypothetical protein